MGWGGFLDRATRWAEGGFNLFKQGKKISNVKKVDKVTRTHDNKLASDLMRKVRNKRSKRRAGA